jgi:hypothetical protein
METPFVPKNKITLNVYRSSAELHLSVETFPNGGFLGTMLMESVDKRTIRVKMNDGSICDTIELIEPYRDLATTEVLKGCKVTVVGGQSSSGTNRPERVEGILVNMDGGRTILYDQATKEYIQLGVASSVRLSKEDSNVEKIGRLESYFPRLLIKPAVPGPLTLSYAATGIVWTNANELLLNENPAGELEGLFTNKVWLENNTRDAIHADTVNILDSAQAPSVRSSGHYRSKSAMYVQEAGMAMSEASSQVSTVQPTSDAVKVHTAHNITVSPHASVAITAGQTKLTGNSVYYVDFDMWAGRNATIQKTLNLMGFPSYMSEGAEVVISQYLPWSHDPSLPVLTEIGTVVDSHPWDAKQELAIAVGSATGVTVISSDRVTHPYRKEIMEVTIRNKHTHGIKVEMRTFVPSHASKSVIVTHRPPGTPAESGTVLTTVVQRKDYVAYPFGLAANFDVTIRAVYTKFTKEELEIELK